jgi:hypothetical protein
MPFAVVATLLAASGAAVVGGVALVVFGRWL